VPSKPERLHGSGMNKPGHGEEQSDAAIQLEFRWIATPAEPGSQ